MPDRKKQNRIQIRHMLHSHKRCPKSQMSVAKKTRWKQHVLWTNRKASQLNPTLLNAQRAKTPKHHHYNNRMATQNPDGVTPHNHTTDADFGHVLWIARATVCHTHGKEARGHESPQQPTEGKVLPTMGAILTYGDAPFCANPTMDHQQ
jgi:hypothetical protein